jgi:glutamyl-tRNA reductase
VDALDGAASRVVDLSMPRAVPTLHRHEASGRVLDVDALATTAPADHDASLRPRLERLAAETIDAFERWRVGSTTWDAAAALAARADVERARALDRLWSRLPDLDADERAAIEAMARHLAGDILREPLSRLTRGHDHEAAAHEAAARELFGL